MSADRIIRTRCAVLPAGTHAADVVVRGGRIDAVAEWGAAPEVLPVTDIGGACLLPGLVDTHVHVNEPGRTEWEGFATATRAAAAGGITTIVDMPLNSIPATTSFAGLAAKRAAAEAAGLRVDCGFWGGVVPGNVAELGPLAAAGVLGFKCFLVPSGVDEFPHVAESDLAEAMPMIARLGLPLLVHAESPARINEAGARLGGRDPRRYATWLSSRPPAAEVEAIRMMLRLCETTGCPVHVVHLSASEALDDLLAARTRGLPVTVETCPHYLCFAAEEIGEGDTRFKCAPPIRDHANQENLIAGLREGVIDLVASDHSPCPPEMKHLADGDFMAAWGGIASLEVGLAAVWTQARTRGASPGDLARWMAEAPARLAGLGAQKGRIVAGADADLVVWDPDAEWTVDAPRLQHRHPVTPYQGRRLTGVVRATFLRGEPVFERDAADGEARFPGTARGRPLARAVANG